nr:class I SAM-dependent methyltransferase [candidate division Zixibacteria bacterium]
MIHLSEDNAGIPFYHSREIISRYRLDEIIPEYIRTVLDFNKYVNIVSRETTPVNLVRLAADCLIPFDILGRPEGRFFDIGSGGGLPGLILLLTHPHLEAVLIERTGKKATFLRDAIKHFDLKARVIEKDFIEAAGQMDPGSFPLGTMKLVRLDLKILGRAISLLKPSGNFIYYADFDSAAIKIPPGFRAGSHRYYLDDNKQLRTFTIFSAEA